MCLIDDHPDIAQPNLAQRLRMDRATTVAIINRLQARKYLVRGPSLVDSRKQTLNPTKEGRAALVVTIKAIETHEAWLKARFTPHEVERLIEYLPRIYG